MIWIVNRYDKKISLTYNIDMALQKKDGYDPWMDGLLPILVAGSWVFLPSGLKMHLSSCGPRVDRIPRSTSLLLSNYIVDIDENQTKKRQGSPPPKKKPDRLILIVALLHLWIAFSFTVFVRNIYRVGVSLNHSICTITAMVRKTHTSMKNYCHTSIN